MKSNNSKIEAALNIESRLSALEQMHLVRQEDVDNKLTIGDITTTDIGNNLKAAETQLDDIMSRITVNEIRFEEEATNLKSKLSQIDSANTAFELKLREFTEQWPTPDESKSTPCKNRYSARNKNKDKISNNKVGNNKLSFKDKHMNKKSDGVVVLGDSLVRGVGKCLERDSHMYSSISCSGAKIEDMERKLGEIGDKSESHIVLMVGTNNIQKEGSEIILSKYNSLIEKTKQYKLLCNRAGLGKAVRLFLVKLLNC